MREPTKVDNVTPEQVKARLATLGVTTTVEDDPLIEHGCDHWISYSLDFMNRPDIPDLVVPRVIDRIVADFLVYKKNMGAILADDVVASQPIEEIREGDTTVKYVTDGSQTNTDKLFLAVIRRLEAGLIPSLVRNRKLKW